jgi:hypothetical protein
MRQLNFAGSHKQTATGNWLASNRDTVGEPWLSVETHVDFVRRN